jgi:hypothetical protein
MTPMTIDERIEQLDLSLFRNALSANPEKDLLQNTDEDRRTLLALQAVMRRQFPGYTYLEVGSYKGSSLQPHVVDPLCGRILSIDPRPGATPDSRGPQHYEPVSAASMLEWLKRIPGADVSKIKTFETTTAGMNGKIIGARPQWCFVDGEHTDQAVLADARFCLSVMAENGVIVFHDANLVFDGLQQFLKELSASGRSFHPHILPDSVFIIEVGPARFCESEPMSGRIEENYKAYLAGMAANDWYRRAYHLPVYRVLRKIRRLFPKRA